MFIYHIRKSISANMNWNWSQLLLLLKIRLINSQLNNALIYAYFLIFQTRSSNHSYIHLFPVNTQTTGVYKCEVSGESNHNGRPPFTSVTGEGHLQVIGKHIFTQYRKLFK